LKLKVFAISLEIFEKRKKIVVPQKRFTEWAALATVVSAYALKRKIKPVRDPPIKPASSVDGRLTVDPFRWKDDHCANRVTRGPERFILSLG
jgi:hypothetical protein